MKGKLKEAEDMDLRETVFEDRLQHLTAEVWRGPARGLPGC